MAFFDCAVASCVSSSPALAARRRRQTVPMASECRVRRSACRPTPNDGSSGDPIRPDAVRPSIGGAGELGASDWTRMVPWCGWPLSAIGGPEWISHPAFGLGELDD